MRKRSIKVRITVWYTALMVLMAAMVLAFVVAISSSVTVQTDLTYLSQTVRGNLNQVSLQDGALELGADFSFVQGGVYTVVYSESGALLAGQMDIPGLWRLDRGNITFWICGCPRAGRQEFGFVGSWRSPRAAGPYTVCCWPRQLPCRALFCWQPWEVTGLSGGPSAHWM